MQDLGGGGGRGGANKEYYGIFRSGLLTKTRPRCLNQSKTKRRPRDLLAVVSRAKRADWFI